VGGDEARDSEIEFLAAEKEKKVRTQMVRCMQARKKVRTQMVRCMQAR
jgi:hypothetical protein